MKKAIGLISACLFLIGILAYHIIETRKVASELAKRYSGATIHGRVRSNQKK